MNVLRSVFITELVSVATDNGGGGGGGGGGSHGTPPHVYIIEDGVGHLVVM